MATACGNISIIIGGRLKLIAVKKRGGNALTVLPKATL